MAVTLIINPGSSSKKFSLIRDGRVELFMRFEQNKNKVELCTEMNSEQQKCEGVAVSVYDSALAHVLEVAKKSALIDNESDITHVGLRVVAPGSFFQKHHVVDRYYREQLASKLASAPLHIPSALAELEQVKKTLPKALLVGVSDSAFHSTLPAKARTYSIKKSDAEKYDIHRFGYHGLSCASVLRSSQSVMGDKQKIIIAHIGSGVSLTAVRNGESIDTTMGFGPGSGMIMGSRAGDIESGALLELMRVGNMDLSATYNYLQTQTGLKGLAGEADLRHLLERSSHGDIEAVEALELFSYRFGKLFGGMVSALGGVDGVIFTATAVERSPVVRDLLLKSCTCFGIELDAYANENLINHDGIISTPDSPVTVALIRTQEIAEMVKITNNFYPQN